MKPIKVRLLRLIQGVKADVAGCVRCTYDLFTVDRLVRESPETAYEAEFMERLVAETPWMLGS